MSTQSIPHLKEAVVAEEKQADKQADKPAEVKAPKLGRASESGDAGVQNLLGLRSIHASNCDEEKLAEVDAQLAELGFAV